MKAFYEAELKKLDKKSPRSSEVKRKDIATLKGFNTQFDDELRELTKLKPKTTMNISTTSEDKFTEDIIRQIKLENMADKLAKRHSIIAVRRRSEIKADQQMRRTSSEEKIKTKIPVAKLVRSSTDRDIDLVSENMKKGKLFNSEREILEILKEENKKKKDRAGLVGEFKEVHHEGRKLVRTSFLHAPVIDKEVLEEINNSKSTQSFFNNNNKTPAKISMHVNSIRSPTFRNPFGKTPNNKTPKKTPRYDLSKLKKFLGHKRVASKDIRIFNSSPPPPPEKVFIPGSFVWLLNSGFNSNRKENVRDNPIAWVGRVISVLRDGQVSIQWFMETGLELGIYQPTNVTFVESSSILHNLELNQDVSNNVWCEITNLRRLIIEFKESMNKSYSPPPPPPSLPPASYTGVESIPNFEIFGDSTFSEVKVVHDHYNTSYNSDTSDYNTPPPSSKRLSVKNWVSYDSPRSKPTSPENTIKANSAPSSTRNHAETDFTVMSPKKFKVKSRSEKAIKYGTMRPKSVGGPKPTGGVVNFDGGVVYKKYSFGWKKYVAKIFLSNLMLYEDKNNTQKSVKAVNIKDVTDVRFSEITNKTGIKYVFEIVFKKSPTLTLYVESEEAREEWFKVLTSFIAL